MKIFRLVLISWCICFCSQIFAATDVTVVNTPDVHVTNKVDVDLGDAPDAVEPTLETVPTMATILKPLLDWMASAGTLHLPPHASVCPAPSTMFFGTLITLDGHCAVLNQSRDVIQGFMAFIFHVYAFLIVFKA